MDTFFKIYCRGIPKIKNLITDETRSHLVNTQAYSTLFTNCLFKNHKNLDSYLTHNFKHIDRAIHTRPVIKLNPNNLKQLASHHILFKCFHTSNPQAFAPLFWIFMKPIVKLVAILSGRRFRYWLKSDPKNKYLMITKIQKNKHWLMKFGIGFSLYAVYYYWSHIEEAPITHRKRFIAFSQSQFQKIADFETQMQVNLLKDKIIRTNHPYYNIVIDVLQKLFNSNRDIPQLNKLANWSVSIVEDDAKNAFVLPNGQIFVFTGMLKIIENTDQLGIVLSHEMAHVLLGHAIELVSYAQILDLAVIVVMGALWAFLPTDGLAIVSQWFYQKVVDIMLHMPYNRKLEKEADFVGLELASKACFDVREAVNFWKIMEENQRKSKKLAENPPEWLSTHPSSSNRARSLDDLMPEALKTREKCQCPRLSGKDPRARHYSI